MIAMNIDRYNFDTSDALALALADRVAAELSVAVDERGHAVLAVSVGCLPEHFFRYLSKIDIAWEHIIITLVDERFVPPDHARSHEGLIRRCLMQNRAAKARFIGLYITAVTAELAAFSAASRINALSKPFDVVVLDMGSDGHIASLLPSGDRLRQAMDCNSRALVVPMHAKGAGEARLTMTLPLLVNAHFIALHFAGEDKLIQFEYALQGGPEADMPVRALLFHAESPVQVFWSPEEELAKQPFAESNHDNLLEIIEKHEGIEDDALAIGQENV